jgi:hypothetical protein
MTHICHLLSLRGDWGLFMHNWDTCCWSCPCSCRIRRCSRCAPQCCLLLRMIVRYSMLIHLLLGLSNRFDTLRILLTHSVRLVPYGGRNRVIGLPTAYDLRSHCFWRWCQMLLWGWYLGRILLNLAVYQHLDTLTWLWDRTISCTIWNTLIIAMMIS